jgi:hypothetical protein
MKSMNDTAQQPSINPSQDEPQGSIGFAKESEPILSNANTETPKVTETGREVALSPDVSAVGVSVHPTVIPMPKSLDASGVQQAGQNVTLGTGESITLPLTDEEIVAGSKQPPTSSWYFLSKWCKRRLEQFGRAIKIFGGKAVEVETR